MSRRGALLWVFLVALLSGCGRRRDIIVPPPSLLLSPADGVIISYNTPSFDWEDVETATTYWAQVDEGASFNSPVINDSTLISSSYDVASPLDDGFYYWRVRVKSETNTWGEWSEVWSFTIDTNPYYVVGVCATPGYAEAVAVAQSLAYVADGQGGLQIIDISDPQSPCVLGSEDTDGYASGVSLLGRHCYVADGDQGLLIIDVGDPQTPSRLGSDSWIHALDVSADSSGDSIHVHIAAENWFIIDDATDSLFPSLLGRCHTPGNARGVWVESGFAYVADEQMGLQIVDISDPRYPAIVGSSDTPSNARNVCVSGNYACVADGRGGLQVIDVANPQEPSIVGSCDTPGYANDVFVQGNLAYIADGTSGLQVISVADPSSPFIVGSCETPYANGVWATDSLVYVADRDSGLVIVGIIGG